jgi:hypothetical protein
VAGQQGTAFIATEEPTSVRLSSAALHSVL